MVRGSIVLRGLASAVCVGLVTAFLSIAAAAAPGGQARGAQAKGAQAAGAQAFVPERPESCPPPPPALFGTKEKTEVSMEGKIYFLPEKATQLPDFSALKSVGSIWTSEWNITPRAFTNGFPGVTDRFEWFALDYQGSIYAPKDGEYLFELGSDDGSKLYLDDQVVIDFDKVHGYGTKKGKVTLTKGDHAFRLSYFQGPRVTIALRLLVTQPGGKHVVFRLQDFDRALIESRDKLGVDETPSEIRVKFGAEVLFDTGKYELKPAATAALTQLAGLLRSYPGFPIVIEGHTDSQGTPPSNQTLSQNRAQAVKTWLVQKGNVPDGCLITAGFGQTRPIAPNGTAAGRQKNRRVEVRLLKSSGPPRK